MTLKFINIFVLIPVISFGSFCESRFSNPIDIYSTIDQVLCKKVFSIGYDYETKQAMWVSYILDKRVSNSVPRNRSFREEKEIPSEFRAKLKDYFKSGYDRGHLFPYASIDYDFESSKESFILSNISPQIPNFNRGIWKSLETKIREEALENVLHVITGTIFINSKKKAGEVRVPTYFYKSIYNIDKSEITSYLIPHTKHYNYKLEFFITSTDLIEELTGLDFFSYLEDSLETKLEGARND